MFTFTVQYKNVQGTIQTMTVSLMAPTQKDAADKITSRFTETFPQSTLISVRG